MKRKKRKGNNKDFNKKAEGPLGMSFSMIFSIILIIVFVMVAFIAVRYFLNLQACAKTGDFVSDIKNKVTQAWQSEGHETTMTSYLPSKIDYICFADLTKPLKGTNQQLLDEIEYYGGPPDSNMFIYPKENACDIPSHKIPHLDMEYITKSRNPYCIAVNKGVLKIKIEKALNTGLVKLS
ncbi:MAG: hypothetical protein Q8N99_06020 [Nanoarchaeota archaeon]|nr:hypothetical protein [Nanoarchaeota archaeon]